MKKILLFVSLFCVGLAVYSESVNDIQSIDGATRNRLSDIIKSSGGGGTFDTSLTYTWTGTNTFGTVYYNNYLVGNSNIFIPTATESMVIFPQPGQTRNNVFIESIGNGVAEIRLDRLPNGPSAFWQVVGGQVLFSGSGSGFTDITFTADSSDMLKMSSSTLTLCDISSRIVVDNAITHTLPNGANINSGVAIIPANTSGTYTNMTDLFVLRTLTASNIVVGTPTGTAQLTTTNASFTLGVNGGAGTLLTQALYTSRTNSLTGTHVINVIYTNNAQRATVSTGIALPSTATTISAASFWTISGGITNWGPIAMSCAGFATGVTTNSIGGEVDPNALYMWSNIVTTAGTPSIVPAYSHEKRW